MIEKKVQKGSKYIKRLLYLLPAVFFLTFTLFIFAPNEIYILNSGEFWFSITDIIKIIILYFAVTTILMCALGALIKNKKAFLIYNAVILGLALGFYIQGNFLNNDYGMLDGSPIEWFWYKRRLVLGLGVWGLCIGVPLAMNIFGKTKQIFFKYNRYVSTAVILIQVITLIVLMVNFTETTKNNNVFTKENLTTLSKNKNVVVFILDAYGDAIFQRMLQEDDYNPREVFKDFTYFDNCTASGVNTDLSLPYLMTGIQYKNLEKYFDYIDNAFLSTQFYNTLAQNNYSASLYTIDRYAPNIGHKIIDNIKNMYTNPTPTSVFSLTNKLYQLCLFRYCPQPIKPIFWLYTGAFNEYISTPAAFDYDIYVDMGDVAFYEDIQKNEWTFQNKNAFKFYHLFGVHPPFQLGRNIKEAKSENLTVINTAIGSLKIVEKYLDIMKEKNTYNDALIILMGDHTFIIDDNDEVYVPNRHHVMFMIKQPNAENDILQFSDAPISHTDFFPTVYEYVTGEKQEGTIYDYDIKNERTRMYYFAYSGLRDTGYKSDLSEYFIYNDPNVLHPTGVIYSQGKIIKERD